MPNGNITWYYTPFPMPIPLYKVGYVRATHPSAGRLTPSIATKPAAPRLACVMPTASVHPEPGSNSSLYNLSISTST